MSEQKYRYLKEGDVRPELYEYRPLGLDGKWIKINGLGNKIEYSDLLCGEYRVPITEEEPKMCEMVLFSSIVDHVVKTSDKTIQFVLSDRHDVEISTSKCFSTIKGYSEAPIGTIWDNVNGKPVRRPTVEKCAVCGCDPVEILGGPYYGCRTDMCHNFNTLQLIEWNNRQFATKELLKKAGWVRS